MSRITDVKTIFSLDYRSLALFRVILGLYLVLDARLRFYFVPYLYSDQSIIPRELVDLDQFSQMYHFQLLFISGSEWYSFAFFSVLMICGVFLLIGYKTRVSTFLCWLLYSSVVIRDPLTTHAADTLLILLLFWGLFLPLSKNFSIDSLLSNSQKNDKKITFSAATVALYFQVSLVYIMTGLFKASEATWKDGSYLYLTLSRFDYVKPFALLVYPFEGLLHFLTIFTLYLEIFGPFLLFIPFFFVQFRIFTILLFTGLQVSIGLMIDVGLFPLISCGAMFVFLPKQFWDTLNSKFPKNWTTLVIDTYSLLQNKFSGRDLISLSKREKNNSSYTTLVNILVTVLILFVTFWNINQVSSITKFSQTVKNIGYALKLDQRWNMFVRPAYTSEYIAVEVKFNDSEKVDLIKNLRVHYGDINGIEHVGYINYRWRILFSNKLRHHAYSDFQTQFLKHKINRELTESERANMVCAELVGYYHLVYPELNLSSVKRRVINRINECYL